MKFEILPSGKSVNGEEIKSFITHKKSSKYIYILGAVHGDEVEGAHLAKELFNWLQTNEEIDFSMVIVPIVNVDGFKAGTRTNANGVDLNRNLPSKQWSANATEAKYFPGKFPLSEPENKFLVELFEKYPPKFIISFHSWYPVINYNGKCKEVAEFLNMYNNYPIEADFISHPTPGSLGEYGPQHLNCPVLTFECPLLSETVSLESIWKENEMAFKQLFLSKFIEEFKN